MRILGRLFFLALLLTLPCRVRAGVIAPPRPLDDSIQTANLIVVGTVTSFTADPPPGGNQTVYGNAARFLPIFLQPAGDYEIAVKDVIAGNVEGAFKLHLPALPATTFDRAPLHTDAGMTALFLLRREPDGRLTPVDTNLPFIPVLPKKIDAPVPPLVRSSRQATLAYLLGSCSDPTLRRVNSYLMSSHLVTDTSVAPALWPYADDPDPATRDNVLYCLLRNQEVTAIPHVALLARAAWTNNENVRCVGALPWLKSAAAVPYLNSLLLEPSPWTRLHAARALERSADQSSIPYLMLALDDSEPLGIVAYSAYRTLHRLVPEMGEPQSLAKFEADRAATSQNLFHWWRTELQGGHGTPAPQQNRAVVLPATLRSLPVALFRAPDARRIAAITEIEKAPHPDHIPALVLALHDPRDEVAYRAYILLNQLFFKATRSESRAAFTADREAVIRDILIWWRDETNGNHNNRILAFTAIK